MRLRILTGPTASGKSAIALRVARRLGGTIINADSQQVYRELQILTARPTPKDESECRHMLYGCLSVQDSCSAGRWRRMAEDAVTKCLNAGETPILVGGTGLYIDALIRGFVEVPEIANAAREAAMNEFAILGQDTVLQRLQSCYGAVPVPTDPARLARAWQVWHATGTSLPVWQSKGHRPPNPNWHFQLVILLPERNWLYERIDRRVYAMLAAGALDEAQQLVDLCAKGSAVLPGLKAHGLPALHAHLAGEMSLDEAISMWQQDTRRYAKRQTTWLRNRWGRDSWLQMVSAQAAASVQAESVQVVSGQITSVSVALAEDAEAALI